MVPGCAHEQRAHSAWTVSIGMANKMQHLQRLWALPNDLKRTETSFSAILTDTTLYLRGAQIPRSPDLAIFVQEIKNRGL